MNNKQQELKHNITAIEETEKPLYKMDTRIIKALILYYENEATIRIECKLFRISTMKYILMFDPDIKGYRFE